MKIVDPLCTILNPPNGDEVLECLESYARVCYKSEGKKDGATHRLIKQLIASGHESPLEHCSITVKVICDRGVSHEWVRHRIASYTQESTRYCNYSADKFGSNLTFIRPYFAEENPALYLEWAKAMQEAENRYFKMLELGARPEDARSVLPNSLKTELICTMNLREWRHFFKLRCAPTAHPAMRQITLPLLANFRHLIPLIFDE